jgi:hypothetical protein
MKNVTVRYVLKGGTLVPLTEADHAKLKLFSKGLVENEVVDLYISQQVDNDKTLGQLAKVHAMIRELAIYTGYSFMDMKEEIKTRAGLLTHNDDGSTTVKSFAACSKDEMQHAIETCYEVSHLIGYQMD